MPQVLALGAELKNTICLTKKNRAFLSQHVGDLENLETYDFFNLTVSHLRRILENRP
jgi:hydrogenase maturation protein HypF